MYDAKETRGNLTSQNMPLQMFVPGEGLPAVCAEDHLEWVKKKEQDGMDVDRTMRSERREETEVQKLGDGYGPLVGIGYGVHQRGERLYGGVDNAPEGCGEKWLQWTVEVVERGGWRPNYLRVVRGNVPFCWSRERSD
jgi:hypothetical protein